MRLSRILPKVLIPLGFILVFVLYKNQDTVRDFFSTRLEFISAQINNFFFALNPEVQRKRPVSLVEAETNLQLYIGEPFRSFAKRDWDKFWNIIYGVFPMDQVKPGLPKKMRQMTEDEIADELSRRYPETFAYFEARHWKIFFSIIFNKR